MFLMQQTKHIILQIIIQLLLLIGVVQHLIIGLYIYVLVIKIGYKLQIQTPLYLILYHFHVNFMKRRGIRMNTVAKTMIFFFILILGSCASEGFRNGSRELGRKIKRIAVLDVYVDRDIPSGKMSGMSQAGDASARAGSCGSASVPSARMTWSGTTGFTGGPAMGSAAWLSPLCQLRGR